MCIYQDVYITLYIHMCIHVCVCMAPLKMGQSLRPRPMPRKQMPGGQGVRRSVALVQNLEEKHGCYMIFILYKYI